MNTCLEKARNCKKQQTNLEVINICLWDRNYVYLYFFAFYINFAHFFSKYILNLRCNLSFLEWDTRIITKQITKCQYKMNLSVTSVNRVSKFVINVKIMSINCNLQCKNQSKYSINVRTSLKYSNNVRTSLKYSNNVRTSLKYSNNVRTSLKYSNNVRTSLNIITM